MTVGFTGTRHGCTELQLRALLTHLEAMHENAIAPYTFHHGGCVGADRQLHDIVRELLWGIYARIVIHPAANMPPKLCDWTDADEVRKPLPPLKRNENIVAAARGGVLLACPQHAEGHTDSRRSGTWFTVRNARRTGVGVVVFAADGTVASGARG